MLSNSFSVSYLLLLLLVFDLLVFLYFLFSFGFLSFIARLLRLDPIITPFTAMQYHTRGTTMIAFLLFFV